MEAVTGDLNGDGKPDLVVTFSDSVDAGGRRLLVLMGNGDGSFATPITMDLGLSFLLVAAVDVNGDQKADLIITAPFKGDSFVLLGNGDGTFQPPRMIGSGVLRVADFNGDGKPDLLCTGLAVRLGNGDGTFRDPSVTPAAQNFTALNFTGAIAVGDFNGDGKLDVAHTSAWHDAFGMVWIWLGNGDGTFRMLPPNDQFSNGNNSPSAPQVVAGDFNGDEKLDLAIGAGDFTSLSGPTTFIGILLGNGDALSAREQPSRFSGLFSSPLMSTGTETPTWCPNRRSRSATATERFNRPRLLDTASVRSGATRPSYWSCGSTRRSSPRILITTASST